MVIFWVSFPVGLRRAYAALVGLASGPLGRPLRLAFLLPLRVRLTMDRPPTAVSVRADWVLCHVTRPEPAPLLITSDATNTVTPDLTNWSTDPYGAIAIGEGIRPRYIGPGETQADVTEPHIRQDAAA